MNDRMKVFSAEFVTCARRFLAAVFWANMVGLTARAADSPILPSWAEALKDGHVGVVIVEVQFAKDGSAKQCRVIRSNAPFPLEASTVDFIEKRWKLPLFAGEARVVPIIFQELPSYLPQWNSEMAIPPNPLAVGDPERNLKLRLTFGADGWVKSVDTVAPSGLDSLDQDTAAWVKVHWHHEAYANQVVEAPFDFKPPVASPPPPPVVKHHVSPPPAEPVPIPAIRAQ
jgi:hypothetical protein